MINGEIKMKFDYIVDNPPYEGNKELHQQIFNKSVDMLKDNGVITFIQPAFPYHTKKKPKKNTQLMRDNIEKYHVDVVIEKPSIFKNAAIATDLAVTTLTKTEDPTINIIYKNDKKYQNIDLDDITMLEIDPKIFRNIYNKYKKYIEKNGSVLDVSLNNKNTIQNIDSNLISIAAIRGNQSENGKCDDFYTIMSNRDYTKNKKDMSHAIISDHKENVYKYLESNIARFGLAITKINCNNHRGELKTVPLIDFSKEFDEEQMYIDMDITKEEKIIMEDIIPYWNHKEGNNRK